MPVNGPTFLCIFVSEISVDKTYSGIKYKIAGTPFYFEKKNIIDIERYILYLW